MTCNRCLTQIVSLVFCLITSGYCRTGSEATNYLRSTLTKYSELDTTVGSSDYTEVTTGETVSSSTASSGDNGGNKCNCSDIELRLGTLRLSSNSETFFEFKLTVKNGDDACQFTNLTGISIQRYGPTATPANKSTCASKETNCSQSKQRAIICTVKCVFEPVNAWVPCGNYTLDVTPEYYGCESEPNVLGQQISVIGPSSGEDIQLTINNVNASSNSFTVRWSVNPEECYPMITSYNMVLESAAESNSFEKQIPLNCTDSSGSEIIFRSDKCPELFSVNPCSAYSVKVSAELNDTKTNYSDPTNFTTQPPDDLKIYVYEVNAGSRWISFTWNLSQTECVTTLTRLMLIGTDTYNPTQTFFFSLPNSCSNQSSILNGEICSANITSSLLVKEQLAVFPCTLYEFFVYPQITGVDYTQVTTFFNSKTIPDDFTVLSIYGVRPDAEWISFNWNLSEPRCENALSGLNLSVTDVGQNNRASQFIFIPRNCSGCNFTSPDHNCSLNMTQKTDSCPSVSISSCSSYQISLFPNIWNTPYEQFFGSSYAKTIPRNDLTLNIFNVQSGAEWVNFNWNLSEPRCENALTGLNLSVTNVEQNKSQPVYIPRDCSGCDFSSSNHNCALNITNDSGSCPSVPIFSCSYYQISVYPKIWDVFYEHVNGISSAKTTPDKDLKLYTYDVSSGSEWISFRWNLSNPRCMAAVTGSQLNIRDEDLNSTTQDLNKPCSGCMDTQDCLMNTTTNKGCPAFRLVPCIDYKVRLYPKIWEELYNPFDNLVTSTTTGDENLHAAVDQKSLSSGSSWISFQWQASAEKCRKKIEGYLIGENLPGKPSFSCPTLKNETIQSFNTSVECFKETIHPCKDYSLSLILKMQGTVVGKPTLINRTTLSDDQMRTNIHPNSSHGLDWFSFKWNLSDQNCNNYLSSYSLNVVEFFNNTKQTARLNIPDCAKADTEGSFAFNSSCPNANLSIVRCTRYVVTISPSLLINNKKYQIGQSPSSKLETSSGDWGEIENPIVSSTEAKAITLEWSEPKCRYNAGIQNYNITISSTWNDSFGKPEEFKVVVTPDCLERLSDWRVSVTLNESMCNGESVKFVSCSPYHFTVLPEFVVTTANEYVQGWSGNTATTPLPQDLGVNLAVKDQGSRWFQLSWNEPNCRIPVINWTLCDDTMNEGILIPPYCPFENNQTGKLELNVSDTLTCGNVLIGLPILPCTSHNFTLKVKLDMIDDILPTVNGTTSAIALPEDPGNVVDVIPSSSASEVNLTWSPPKENPQCVLGYQILWEGKSEKVNQTSITIDKLEACSNFSVVIIALSEAKPLLNRVEIEVSTKFVDPGPVNNTTVYFNFHNRSVGLLTWDKPNDDIDDCVTGYRVKIRETDYENLTYSTSLSGKYTTEVYLFEEDFQRGKSYVASVTSICSFSGSSSESATRPFSWSSSSEMRDTAVMIVLPIICTISLLLLVGLVVLIRKKRAQKETDDYYTADYLQVMRKPIPIEDFERVVAFLEADSSYELSKEYEEIKKLSTTSTCEAAKKVENQEKNRYLDILPYDHSRVKLRAVHFDGSERSDYINASFIMGFGRTPLYVAAQGPKPSTIEDFWTMCLEHEVRVIVALTTIEERGKIKCAQYWPSEGALEHGCIRVELLSSTQKSFYTQRKFSVAARESSGIRIINQLHFTIWPDFGCPDSPESLLELVFAMRKENSSAGNSSLPAPIVVHCSAGVGRTGTLIALDLLMKQASQQRVVDVFGTTLKIRQDRGKMIQNEDQYRFLYRCLGHYINREFFNGRFTN